MHISAKSLQVHTYDQHSMSQNPGYLERVGVVFGSSCACTSASPFVAISLKQVQLQCVDVDSAAGRLLSRGVLPDHLADVRQTQRRFRRRRALPG